jgi:hypothetical protein
MKYTLLIYQGTSATPDDPTAWDALSPPRSSRPSTATTRR